MKSVGFPITARLKLLPPDGVCCFRCFNHDGIVSAPALAEFLFFRSGITQTASRLGVSDGSSENRRSNCSLPVDVWLGFRRATAVRFGLVLFPVPAHRTGQADFPHPALGKDSRCSV